MKDSISKKTVTISYKSSNLEKVTSFTFSRIQFEILVILIPATIISGIIAVGFLFYEAALGFSKSSSSSDAGEQFQENLFSAADNELKEQDEAQPTALDDFDVQSGINDQGKIDVSKENLTANLPASNLFDGQFESSNFENQHFSFIDDIKQKNDFGLKTLDYCSKLPGDLYPDLFVKRKNMQKIKTQTQTQPQPSNLSESVANNSTLNHQVAVGDAASTSSKIIGNKDTNTNNKVGFSFKNTSKIDRIFEVTTMISQQKKNSLVLAKVSMKNLTGKREQGYIWVKALVNSEHEHKWLSSKANLIEKKLLDGEKFLFKSKIDRVLSLGNPRFLITSVKEIHVGAHTEKHGLRIAKVNLRDDADWCRGQGLRGAEKVYRAGCFPVH